MFAEKSIGWDTLRSPGQGTLGHVRTRYTWRTGDVLWLPAAVGVRSCQPHDVVRPLEISLPQFADTL
jgi:hypothetical protein